MWNFIFAVPKVNSMIHLQKGYHISTAWNTGNYAGLVKSDLTVYYYEHNSKEKKYYTRNGFAILKNENGDRYKFPSQMFYYDLPDTLPWRYVE